MNHHRIFRTAWWLCNVLLIMALLATGWTGAREYAIRRYLQGFSDAIIPETSSPRAKVEAILSWMRFGPPRLESANLLQLSPRDPQDTLNYRQLLQVCGSATNAFLNLARSSGVPARRLLLLTPEHRAKHVVAEVYLDERWVVVDPTYRAFLKDSHGNLLTRKQLQDSKVFNEAAGLIPNYVLAYSYESFAHVRVPGWPFRASSARAFFDRLWPGWDEYVDWSLLLERRSFLYLFLALNAFLSLVIARVFLAWLADRRLLVPRFRLRHNLARAAAALFTTPGIK